MGSLSSSFSNLKNIQVTITLGAGKTFSNGSNSFIVNNMRVSVNIDMGGTFMGGNLRIRIFGLSQSDMNQLTYFAWMPQPQLGPPNKISVTAIDGDQNTLVFTGMIIQAYGNYQAMPEVFLDVQATATQAAQLVSVTPLSVAGNTTVATIMAQLAKQMGFSFENNGVNIAVPRGTYLGNTAYFQAQNLMLAYNFDMFIDRGILAICPLGQSRKTPIVPLISSTTGMIGYPYFNTQGMLFDTIFNPNIIFGGTVEVKSEIAPVANGMWYVTNISHTLECLVPGGRWQSTVNCFKNKVGGTA
jgi:hypothetical protein